MQTKTADDSPAKARRASYAKMFLWSAGLTINTAGTFMISGGASNWLMPLFIFSIALALPFFLMNVMHIVLDEREAAQADKGN